MEMEILVRKINVLRPEQMDEVERFIDFLVLENKRKTRAAAIASYVAKHAGTDADLDPELEAAAVEFLLQQDGE